MFVRFLFVNCNNKYINFTYIFNIKKVRNVYKFLCKVFKNENDDVLCIIVFHNTLTGS